MFKNIDYNSCLHEEYCPYKTSLRYLIYPPRFRQMYFEELFDYYDLDTDRKGKIPLDKLKEIGIEIDDLREIQRSAFYMDKWYDILPDITFPSIFIDLKPSHRITIMNRNLDKLKDLENEIYQYMKEYQDWKWFVKLNSVSPKDRSVSGKELKYDNPVDIILRLTECNRTFTFICEDPDSCIVLRKWYDIPRSMEFRCFIRKNKLRAISQYHCDDFFPELIGKKEYILSKIKEFYMKNSSRIPYEDAVMDICILNKEVYLIEFNQFGAETACGSCLYNWDLDYQILYHSEECDMRIREYDPNTWESDC